MILISIESLGDFLKKINRSFTFWLIVSSLVIIALNFLGQDTKSILLFDSNPVLKLLFHINITSGLLQNGIMLPRFEPGLFKMIPLNFYLVHLISYTLIGVLLDILAAISKKQIATTN